MARNGWTADEYKQMLQALLPPGIAWTRSPTATLTDVLDSLSQELARIDARGFDLLVQRDPSTATEDELLSEHEDDLDLPEMDMIATNLESQRQTWAHNKHVLLGELHKSYWIERAAQYGFEIKEINEYDAQHWFDYRAPGQEYYNIFDWQVVLRFHEKTNIIYARAGQVRCGDPLVRIPFANRLEKFLDKWKPGHTRAMIRIYPGGPEYSSAFSPAFNRWDLYVDLGDSLSFARQGGYNRGFDAGYDIELDGPFNGYHFSEAFKTQKGGGYDGGYTEGFSRILTPKWDMHGGFERDAFADGFSIP